MEVWNEQNVWQYRAPLIQARADFAVGELHGEIYVVGGYGRVTECLDMEYYCPRSNCWTVIPENAREWTGVRAGVVRNALYLFYSELVTAYRKDNPIGRKYYVVILLISNICVT